MKFRIDTKKDYTILQVSLFQFISRYSPEIRVPILYHRNPIPTLIWHPVASATCVLISRISLNYVLVILAMGLGLKLYY